VETVTFTQQNPATAAVATAKALRGDPSLKDIAAGESYGWGGIDSVFVIWSSTIPGKEPKHGDTITDAAGKVWTILSAALQRFSTQYRCLVQRNA
jgi:hypothetical protein